MSASTQVRIVVVDDHPVVRDGLSGMIAQDDRIVVVGEADDGATALEVIARMRPDVVLMDLRMPGMDGLSAIHALRRESQQWPHILVLTTYDTDQDIHAAVDAGADGFLLKATPRVELIEAVLQVAAGGKVLSDSAAASLFSRGRVEHLTDRELEVLRAISRGGTNRSIAAELLVSEATVKTHLLRLYPKLGVHDRAAAVRVAFERGLLH